MLNLVLRKPVAVPPYQYLGEEKSFTAEGVMVKLDPYEMDCLELKILEDTNELVVIRHGSGHAEGEIVYSECLDGLEP